MNTNELFKIHVLPRASMEWGEFLEKSSPNSIALDGVVRSGPNFCGITNRVNFDHHDMVVREATMSTAMQVYFAIKGGMVGSFLQAKGSQISIWINDTDQDTSLAVWLLLNYKKFEGNQSIPHVSRLLALTDRWDITGGAFPMNLDEQLVRQHSWVFRPYSDLRTSGSLANAGEAILRSNLEAVLRRLDKFMMGEAEEVVLDTRYRLLYDSPEFKIIDEIGGSEARYKLFSEGLNAFISIVARRDDGRLVCSVGRRSRYIPFPVRRLYGVFNEAERLEAPDDWNGSDIVGGSPRAIGTGLGWEQLRDLTISTLDISS